MKSAFRRRQTFLVELIQTVISTVETRHRQTSIHSRRPHIQLFTFFLVVFFFIILSMFQCTQKAPHAASVLVPPNSSLVVMGRRKGQINNVIGASDKRKRGMKLKAVFIQWYHVSGSWLMSVKLVSLRMTLIRSRESACRIRSNCTCRHAQICID